MPNSGRLWKDLNRSPAIQAVSAAIAVFGLDGELIQQLPINASNF